MSKQEITIIPIPAFNDNYIWLLINKANNESYVVDPGDATPVIEHLVNNDINLAGILITHHHSDHTGGVIELVDKYNCKVFGPKKESIPKITNKLDENSTIILSELGGLNLQIFDVPGHTSGHIAYYGDRMLFCGDTLFVAGCGRLFEGTAIEMFESLGKFKNLPPNTKVYCAHEYTLKNLAFATIVEPNNQDIIDKISKCEYLRSNNIPTVPSTIESELKTNPFMRVKSSDQLAKIRRLKDRF